MKATTPQKKNLIERKAEMYHKKAIFAGKNNKWNFK
jgi:hypothetical protein